MRRALHLFLVFCAVLTLLGLAAAGYRWYAGNDSGSAADDTGGHKPVNTGRVVSLGTLEPSGGVRDVGATAGDRVKELKVAAGDLVEQGAALAYLESYPLRLTEKQSAELALNEAVERRKIEEAYANNLVAEAELGVEQVKLEQFDLDSLAAAAGLSKKNLDVAEGDLVRMQNLTKNDNSIISPQELNHQKLLVDQARAKLASDQAMLSKSRSVHEFSIRQANEKLEAAKVGGQRLLAAIDLDALRSQVELANDRIEMSVVRAPISGQVLEIVTQPGQTIGQEPVVRMGDTKRMYAIAEVYETQVSQIAKGQHATVTSDALDAPLTGKVDFIGTLVAKNQVFSLVPTDNTDLRVVKVHVSLDGSEVAARLVNLQVRVEIDTHPAGSGGNAAKP